MSNPPAAVTSSDLAGRRFGHRVRRALSWGRVFRAVSYARSALWLVPLVAIVVVLVLAPVIRVLDRWLGWNFTNLAVDGAQALCNTVITLTLSFVVFTFGSLLVALQVAGGQLTPRIIATTLLRDNVVRYSVGLFVFTLVLAVMTLNRLTAQVPQMLLSLIGLLGISCMTVFLFFIDYAARLLRPVTVVSRLGAEGLKVLDLAYPDLLPGDGRDAEPAPLAGPVTREVLHEEASEIILAVDVPTLVEAARVEGGVVEIVPQVGDFLAFGQALYRLHGRASAIDDTTLREAVAFGTERTLEQDPIFAFRILVDIALKALSPAINDPTTAVLALDQIHRLLRIVGQRKLQSDAFRDDDGALRLVLRTPGWEDFVHISCCEIRACGANSMQVARRLAAMFEDLCSVLAPSRRPALEQQYALLQRSVMTYFPMPEDLALARVPDVQGMGGTPGVRRPGP